MLEMVLLSASKRCDGKDIGVRFSSRTQDWHADIGGAFRGSSTIESGPEQAVNRALAAFEGYKQRKAERKTREEQEAANAGDQRPGI